MANGSMKMQSFSPYWFYPWLVEGPATYGRFRFFTVRDKTPLKPPFLLGRKNQIYLGMLGNYFHQTKPEPIFFPLRLAFLSALPLHKLNFHYYVSIHEQIRLFFESLVTTAEQIQCYKLHSFYYWHMLY